MMHRPIPAAVSNFFRRLRLFLRWLSGGRTRREIPAAEADSYVGLFQGVIETDAPAPARIPRPQPNATRASGFVRLEVDKQKKATGCFLFFADGKVLTGAIEGSSGGAGFVEASFRLNTDETQGMPRPVAAVGRLTLETRSPHRAAGQAGPPENMTIRFV